MTTHVTEPTSVWTPHSPVRTAVALLGLSLMMSCAHVQVNMPMESESLPETYSLFDPNQPIADQWWRSWQSDELNRLIDLALTNGFSIQTAEARLRQAAAVARREASALVPEITLSGGASYTEREQNDVRTESETYSLKLAGSYELDLWGRVSSIADAAEADFEASRLDLRTARITLAGQVAETWVNLLVQQNQLSLLNSQRATSEKTLELLNLRFNNGLSTSLDVFQQQQVVEEAGALIPLAEAKIAVLQHQLAILLGLPATTSLELTPQALPTVNPVPGTGLPVDLLANRPDIRASGYRLVAAGERVQAAQANRLPALRLTADAGYAGEDLSTLFDNWLANLAGNLLLPLLDGGNRRAQVSQAEALRDERLVDYRKTVYQAVADVEDALIQEQKQVEHLEATVRQLEAARNGLTEAIYRYRNGLQDYLAVLTQQLSVQRLERDWVARKGQRLLYRVALHRALGGDPLAVSTNPVPDEEGSHDVD